MSRFSGFYRVLTKALLELDVVMGELARIPRVRQAMDVVVNLGGHIILG